MSDGLVPVEILDHLEQRHAEVHRHYHTWTHIEALLSWQEKLARQLNDPTAVELAVLFHDAIYDPHATDNEAQSAALMMSALDGRVPPTTLARANRLILATAGHQLPDTTDPLLNADCAFFLDMDLSILGAAPAAFDTYEQAIRKEYAFVPAADYRQGRGAILRDFQARERLYFTDYFHDRLDRQARANLTRSIEKLQRA